ncbi:hypothetical protein GQ54DRAFT_299501 [Martensiomyces pterosporus]|nr:hypothetical protein GQ54DRAFT_299501 [Martensiomyces pterosporus]
MESTASSEIPAAVSGYPGIHLRRELSSLMQPSTESLPTYDMSCDPVRDRKYLLEQVKHMSRTLSATDMDTNEVVFERKFKGFVSLSAQILKHGVATWSCKTENAGRAITLSRLYTPSSGDAMQPPTYEDIEGAREIKLVSIRAQPPIFNLSHEDRMGTLWLLRWMRREDYDNKDYSSITTRWTELVCVDRSNLRILANIGRRTKGEKSSGYLTISSTLLPDVQEFLLTTAIVVYDAFSVASQGHTTIF